MQMYTRYCLLLFCYVALPVWCQRAPAQEGASAELLDFLSEFSDVDESDYDMLVVYGLRDETTPTSGAGDNRDAQRSDDDE